MVGCFSILELGKGFSFVSRQYRMTAEDEEFYIDLVFYNYILKCFVYTDDGNPLLPMMVPPPKRD